MSEPLSEDKQITLINIYFGFILTSGLASVVQNFLLKYPDILNGFYTLVVDPAQFTGLILTPINLFYSINLIFFVIVYLWIILHWIIYHVLIAINPYMKPTSFIADVLFLSIIFFILTISFSVKPFPSGEDNENPPRMLLLFVTSFVILHIIGFITFALFGQIDKDKSKFKESGNRFSKFFKKLFNYGLNRSNQMLHLIFAILFGILLISFKEYTNTNYYYLTLILIVLTYALIKFYLVKKRDDLILIERSPLITSPQKEKFYNNEYSKHYSDKFINKKCYWYHIRVQNKNILKPAVNCTVYLETCKKYEETKENNENFKNLPNENFRRFVEFKWKSVKTTQIVIEPSKYREFDGLCLYFDDGGDKPIFLYLGINQNIVDNDKVKEAYRIIFPGHHLIQFVLYSLNLKPVRKIFILHLDQIIVQQQDSNGEKYVTDIEFHSNTKDNITQCKSCPEYFKKNVSRWKSIPKML